jgi:hypothetical protein
VERLERGVPTYELTNEYKNKLYFDFDFKLPEGEPLDLEYAHCLEEYIFSIIKEFFEINIIDKYRPRIAIAVSHGYCNEKKCNKYSVRAYVPNLVCSRKYNAVIIDQLNEFISEGIAGDRDLRKAVFTVGILDMNTNFLDNAVYSHNRKMRCVGISKLGENRPLEMKIGSLEDSVITWFFDEDAIDITPKDFTDDAKTSDSPCIRVAYPPATKSIVEMYLSYSAIIMVVSTKPNAIWEIDCIYMSHFDNVVRVNLFPGTYQKALYIVVCVDIFSRKGTTVTPKSFRLGACIGSISANCGTSSEYLP